MPAIGNARLPTCRMSPAPRWSSFGRRRRRASPRAPRARRPSITTFRRSASSPGSNPKTRNSSWSSTLPTRMKIRADRATPGSAATSRRATPGAPSASGRRRPLEERRSRSGRRGSARSPCCFTPAVIESSATISPTPIATPATVSAVRALRRIRFFRTSPAQVTAPILSSATLGAAMEPARDAILKALEHVIDPELRRPVTELDMVRDVEIDGGDVSVTIALTVAGCPLRDSFQDQVAEHVGAVPGRRARPARLRRDEPRREGGADDQAARRRRGALEGHLASTARRACSRSRAARAASASRR